MTNWLPQNAVSDDLIELPLSAVYATRKYECIRADGYARIFDGEVQSHMIQARVFIDSWKRSLKHSAPSRILCNWKRLMKTWLCFFRILNMLNTMAGTCVCNDLKVIGIYCRVSRKVTQNCPVSCVSGTAETTGRRNSGLPERSLFHGAKNIKYTKLVEPGRIYCYHRSTTSHKAHFTLIKQLVKALNKQEHCFAYLCSRFPSISNE